ncbi:TetR family transcriptional regulator [Streptomyces nitrosporeus]|uniref:TetR/AcrR family transcriptional regulator n=1 Tax=Streptomyces nitrosporeus TaxID=28894 RepID=UPI0039A29337
MDAEDKSRRGETAHGRDGSAPARPAPGARRPGSHDPEGNRRAVLDAARRLFGARGYQGASVRAIAAEAGVTPGLVMAYFGTKDGLFREAVAGGTGLSDDLAAGGAAALPDALARGYLERWDRLPPDDPWPALIRSALSHPPSAGLLRTILEKQVGEPLGRILGDVAGADVRAGLVRSILFGVIMERYVFAHEPAASLPAERLRPALAEVLATAFGDAVADAVPEAATDAPPDAAARAGADVAAADAGSGAASGSGPVTRAGRGAPGEPRPDAPAGESVLGLLDACARSHRELVDRTVRAHGLSPSAYEVLATLRAAGAPYRLPMGEVAAAGTVRAGGLTQHADRLEAAGLLRRERDAGDRRVVRLCLTPKGLGLAARVFEARAALERDLLGRLAPGDRRRLTGLLGGLGATLDRERGNKGEAEGQGESRA